MRQELKARYRDFLVVSFVFLSCWTIIIIRPLGLNLSLIPGDLTDSRFNIYILEHFYQNLIGVQGDYWNAPFFFPFPYTTAFSDNHLGTGLFYSFFRLIGNNRETSFQLWYLLSFVLNFTAACYVLHQYNYKLTAILAGSILFTFGLPVLAQDIHAQLSYRFCIPLSCYFLVLFSQKPALKTCLLSLFFAVWQLYISIYLGYFLLLLLCAILAILPFQQKNIRISAIAGYWPNRLDRAWKTQDAKRRWAACGAFGFLIGLVVLLVLPYYAASQVYDTARTWKEIETMLPRWQSFFIADRSRLWRTFYPALGKYFSDVPMRWEHQMFIGLPALLMIILGPVLSKVIRSDPNYALNGLVLLSIILLVIDIDGFSIYQFAARIPGIKSFRAVSRIILVLIWPAAVLCALIVNHLSGQMNSRFARRSALLLLFLISADSSFFSFMKYSKEMSIHRIQTLREQFSPNPSAEPILFVAQNDREEWQITEIDGMLLAQEMNIPTLNGYSGFFPYGIIIGNLCNQPQYRLARYTDSVSKNKKQTYLSLEKRLLTIGMDRCAKGEISAGTGKLSNSTFANTKLEIMSIHLVGSKIAVKVNIINNSPHTIPAISLTSNPFRLSWRFTDLNGVPATSFDSRKDLVFDVPAKSSRTIELTAVPPNQEGEYYLQVTALQEKIAWFHEKGLSIPRSKEKIIVSKDHTVSIVY